MNTTITLYEINDKSPWNCFTVDCHLGRRFIVPSNWQTSRWRPGLSTIWFFILQNTINLILDKIGRRILEVFDGRYWSNNFIKFPDNKEAENPEWICVPNPSCAVVRKDGGLFVFKSEDSCFPARLKCVSPYRPTKAYKLQKASLLPPIYRGHVITGNLYWKICHIYFTKSHTCAIFINWAGCSDDDCR